VLGVIASKIDVVHIGSSIAFSGIGYIISKNYTKDKIKFDVDIEAFLEIHGKAAYLNGLWVLADIVETVWVKRGIQHMRIAQKYMSKSHCIWCSGKI